MNTLKPWQVQPHSNIGIRFPSQLLTNDAISTKFCRSAAVRIFSQISPQSVPIVTIPYTELKDQSADLSGKIEQAFGSNGLDIPSISETRGRVKKKLEDPYSRYNIGWSLGKEQFESGKPDMMKGSYYANPILDVPTTELSHVERGTLDSFKLLSAPFREVRDEKLRFPKEVNIHEFMVPDESISFGDYTEKLLDKCYDLK